MQKQESGFTLVELSIVLVIIGLIVAGVVAGQSLIKSASLKSITSDIDNFRVAITTFKLEYDYLPGDLPNAYDYWDATCDATDSNCNGNGNGRIEYISGNDAERFRIWQHLNLASLLPGNYTGVGGGAGGQSTPGVNSPAAKIADGTYMAAYLSTASVNYPGPDANYLLVGGFVVNAFPGNALFTPSEAYSIDIKFDDGLPDIGKIYGRYYNNGAWQTATCLAGVSPNRTYDLTRTATECVLYFDL